MKVNSIYVKLDKGNGEDAAVHRGRGQNMQTRQYKRITFSSYGRLERITQRLAGAGYGSLGATHFSLIIHNPELWE